MQYFKAVIPKNNAVRILSAMQTIGNIQFVDRNSHVHGPVKGHYADVLKTCNETLGHIVEIEKKMESKGIEIVYPYDVESFYIRLEEICKASKENEERTFLNLVKEIKDIYKKLLEYVASRENMNSAITTLKKKLCFYHLIKDLVDEQSIERLVSIVSTEEEGYLQQEQLLSRALKEKSHMHGSAAGSTPIEIQRSHTFTAKMKDIGDINTEGVKIGYASGLIKTSEVDNLMRGVYRMARGKVIIQNVSFSNEMMRGIENPDDPESKENLTAFLIILPTSPKTGNISKKIAALVSSCKAKLLPLPTSHFGFDATVRDLESQVSEMSHLLGQASDANVDKIYNLSLVSQDYGISKIEEYRLKMKKYKLIFTTLCLFHESSSLLVGSFWAAKKDVDHIIHAVDKLKENDPGFISANIYPVTHDRTPPTLFRTNDFTQPFQTIVETFSIPRYKEINPALVTTVTFPFLFGLMFGDVAHGLALFLIAVYVASSKMYKSKDLRPLYKIRYLLLLMGFFSVYCGFIYNDFLGVKMYNYRSCYDEGHSAPEHNLSTSNNTTTETREIMIKRSQCTYPVGFDHVWGFAKNEITFENSFKMKFSIIVGFLQMMLGIVFKGWNAIYFWRYIEFIFEFIPQVIFMTAIFGYMCLLIIVKWLTDWTGRDPPSIINVFTSLTNLVAKVVTLA